MKIASPSITKAEAEVVRKFVFRCLRTLSKKEYDLNINYQAAKVYADKILRLYTRVNGCSGANASILSICTTPWQLGNKRYKEYNAFNNHPIIGGRPVGDNADILECIIAHEVAHHVQYRYLPRVPRLYKIDDKPHGPRFKYCYQILRRDLVNPRIDAKLAALSK